MGNQFRSDWLLKDQNVCRVGTDRTACGSLILMGVTDSSSRSLKEITLDTFLFGISVRPVVVSLVSSLASTFTAYVLHRSMVQTYVVCFLSN